MQLPKLIVKPTLLQRVMILPVLPNEVLNKVYETNPKDVEDLLAKNPALKNPYGRSPWKSR